MKGESSEIILHLVRGAYASRMQNYHSLLCPCLALLTSLMAFARRSDVLLVK